MRRCSDCSHCKVRLSKVYCKVDGGTLWFNYQGMEREVMHENRLHELFGESRRRDSNINKRAETCHRFDSMDD